MFVDVGVYGFTRDLNRTKALRTYEKFTLEHQGYQALYAETLMTYEEVCAMFPRELYFKARKKYPETVKAFPEMYEKISSVARESDLKDK